MAWALVSTIMDQLGSLFASKFTSMVNFEEEVEKLNDAEERQVKEKAVNYRP